MAAASVNVKTDNSTTHTANPIRVTEVANAAGLNKGYVSRVLRGHCDPSLSTLRALASAMGVGLDKLVVIIDGNQTT